MPDSVPRGLLGVFRASKKETIAPIPVKIAMFWDRLGDDAGRYPGLGLLAIGRHDGWEDAEGVSFGGLAREPQLTQRYGFAQTSR